MRKIVFLLAVLSIAIQGNAQQVRPKDAGKIYHEIAQLKHLTHVLYVAAHPDDENTRLLAWLSYKKNITTAYMSLTRGEGGQNILGEEQGAGIGLLRTYELLAARHIDGAQQFFSTAIDFGFTKSASETLNNHWNINWLTSDMVLVMRKFRPDVVICRFPPDKRAGHGQHAVSAIVAAKAFKVAGNVDKFPEQLRHYAAWQPKRLLFNAYHFGSMNTTNDQQFKVKTGEYLPLFGMGTGEIGGLSRSMHKCQGAGTPQIPGVQTEYFQLVEGDTLTQSLFDGIDITWNRVNRPDIGEDIHEVLKHFNFRHPDREIPALLAIRKKIETVRDDYWRNEKLQEINKIILDCSGFLAEVYTNQSQAVAGASLPFTLHVIARSHTPVVLKGINWLDATTQENASINHDSLLTFTHTITIPENTPLTQPYWLTKDVIETGWSSYDVENDSLKGLAKTPNNLNAVLHLKIGDQNFDVNVPLSYKELDPIKGDVVEQLRIVPAVTVAFASELMITDQDGGVDAEVQIHAFKDEPNSSLQIQCITPGVLEYSVHPEDDFFRIKGLNLRAGTDTVIHLHLTPKSFHAYKISGQDLSCSVIVGNKSFDLAQHIIKYPHIPTLQYFTSHYAKILGQDWKCTAKHIGYIDGAGDKIVPILRMAGLNVTILKDADLLDASKLKKYDAIVTGIRAVNVDKRMPDWIPVLLQYVKNGGTLVMQYNTLQDLSTTNIGPYPMTLSHDRVTEENANVTFLHPDNKLLNHPNKITEDDFKNWVQERGLYFPSKWDKHYTPLFSMHDTGEQPLDGCTLYTKYGKGNYIYTTFSFFRELPSGNVGALRLFMNMLSAGK